MHPEETLNGTASPPRRTSFEACAAHSDSAEARGRPGPNQGVGHAEDDAATHVVCAIPARYASQRLPGKPLRQIAGRPMIQHVVERVQSAPGITRTVVLTDDERIAKVVAGFGAEVEITPEDCASGTDRIAWAARSWQTPEANGKLIRQAVINVQGDEPMIDPDLVGRVASHLADHPTDEMVTVATPFTDEMIASGAASDASNVKVVTSLEGKALYFSRSLLPFPQDASQAVRPRLHVGLYGYRLDVLERLAALPPSPLEQTESLEQLRALENGIAIRVLNTDHPAFGVDTEQDLVRAEALLSAAGTS